VDQGQQMGTVVTWAKLKAYYNMCEKICNPRSSVSTRADLESNASLHGRGAAAAEFFIYFYLNL
jgi:hypothetical protein